MGKTSRFFLAALLATLSCIGSGPPAAAAPTFSNFSALKGTAVPAGTMGAVGSGNHVVAVLNSEVRVQDRSGNELLRQTLADFFSPLGTVSPSSPHVVFDTVDSRWIVVAANRTGTAASSGILVAWSAGADPTAPGTWTFANLIGTAADYPRVGFTRDVIAVTANVVPPAVGAWIMGCPRSAFYSGGSCSFWADPAGSSLQPASTNDPGLSPLYLVSKRNGSSLRIGMIAGAGGPLSYTGETAVVTAPAGSEWADVDRGDFAPQLGGPNIATHDTRVQNAAYRNGSIWCAQTVYLPAPAGSENRTAAQWWEIATADWSVRQLGRVDDPGGTTFYAYPTIAVNTFDDVLLGYSAFSAGAYPEADMSFRYGGDPPGTMQGVSQIRAGDAPYDNPAGGLNDWGTGSAAVVDPADDTLLWTIQEYAAAPEGGNDRWGTWWGIANPAGGSTDAIPPTVTSFVAPSPVIAVGAPVAVQVTVAATDNVGVTGYLVTESSAFPPAGTWSTGGSITYSFATAGNKTLYAWAMDTAGNISAPVAAPVQIAISDAPVVTSFTVPAVSSTLMVPITAFTAVDGVGVTGYLVTETSTTPSATTPQYGAWSTTPPASYTFAAPGAKTLFAWAKNAAGKVSAPLSAPVIADPVPPAVTVFVVPAASPTPNVPITAFTATDNIGVTGYLVTTDPAQPSPADPRWTPTAWTGFTVGGAGSTTLYAWAMDAAGNISPAASATVLVDTVPPVVTAFSLPALSSSLTVPITAFTAADDFGVAAYLVTATPATPSPSDPGWSAVRPASYTAAAPGPLTLYAWAMDGAGNISGSRQASMTVKDTVPPTVTAFQVPANWTTLVVPVDLLTATDLVGVTGYMVTETATKLLATDSRWRPAPPATFTLSGGGTKTLYAWAKDAAGNVSAGVPATVTVTLQITTATLPPAKKSVRYSQQLTATGGVNPLTWGIAAGALPRGLSLTSSGGLTGTPTVSGSFSFTVQVNDARGATARSSLTLDVSP